MRVLNIEIDIEGPIMTAGLETSAFGVDVGFLRDLDGHLIVADTLIKGVVREVLEDMSAAAPSLLSDDDVIEWFGAESGDARDEETSGDFIPHRGIVRFGDFELSEIVAGKPITRIQVAPDTGSPECGMLAVLEAPIPPGRRARCAVRLPLTRIRRRRNGWKTGSPKHCGLPRPSAA